MAMLKKVDIAVTLTLVGVLAVAMVVKSFDRSPTAPPTIAMPRRADPTTPLPTVVDTVSVRVIDPRAEFFLGTGKGSPGSWTRSELVH
jgi:hypothetical protein